MVSTSVESSRESRPRPAHPSASATQRSGCEPRRLDPDALPDYIDRLYRAAWALCGSPHDAEDLVQETFLNVLKRPRFLRREDDLGYLLQALRNTYANSQRRTARRPRIHELYDADNVPISESEFSAHDIMRAIKSAPALFRDAVIAVDVLGLSYRAAARSLRTREATVATRLHRGRQHIARELLN
jgi:RNA polymerase sigma-70 factor (ECF subfamily)